MNFFTEEKIEEIHANIYRTVKEKFKLSEHLQKTLIDDYRNFSFKLPAAYITFALNCA